jgi:hypothetical protein
LCIKNPDIYSIKNNILTNNDTCIICLSQEQYMVVLECKHIYCTLCLQQYFFINTHICCYCRKIINDDMDRHKIYKLYE